jgi:anti-sigma B factor antagonist
MNVKSETLPSGVGVIEVRGPLLGDQEIAELRRAIAEFIDRQWRRLLIDLTEATFLNSTGMGVLVSAHTSYAKRGWQLKLCGINKRVNLVFAITNLKKVFAIYDAREDALTSFLQTNNV